MINSPIAKSSRAVSTSATTITRSSDGGASTTVAPLPQRGRPNALACWKAGVCLRCFTPAWKDQRHLRDIGLRHGINNRFTTVLIENFQTEKNLETGRNRPRLEDVECFLLVLFRALQGDCVIRVKNFKLFGFVVRLKGYTLVFSNFFFESFQTRKNILVIIYH